MVMRRGVKWLQEDRFYVVKYYSSGDIKFGKMSEKMGILGSFSRVLYHI